MSNFKNRLDKLESITIQDRMIHIFTLSGVITSISPAYNAYVGKTVDEFVNDYPHKELNNLMFDLINIVEDTVVPNKTIA